MYVLIVEYKIAKDKKDKWKKCARHVCADKAELEKSLRNTEWLSNTYYIYRMTYYKVDLSSAVTVQSKVVHEEVK